MPSTYRFLSVLFKRQQAYDDVRTALQGGAAPPSRGLRKILSDLEIDAQGDVVYKPEELTIVAPNDIDAVLRREYADLTVSAGKGYQALYEAIRQRYANITRSEIREFLLHEPSHMVGKDYRKERNRPVVARRVDAMWQMDLIEIDRLSGHNNQKKYILTVCDVFSSYLWTAAFTKKLGTTVRDAFAAIVNGEGGRKPTLLQSDNAREFSQGAMRTYCQQHNIKQSTIRTHYYLHKIESINKRVRVMLRDAMIRNQTLSWVQYLPTITESWNTTTHSGQKQTPQFLYQSAADDADEEMKEALEIREEQAKKKVARNKAQLLAVGDVVRVSLAAVSTKVREELKALKTGKDVIVKWSPELYRIRSIIRPPFGRYEMGNPQYTLETMANPPQPLRVEFDANNANNRSQGIGRFYPNELQLVAKANEPLPGAPL
jgi:transposase InsO family protein